MDDWIFSPEREEGDCEVMYSSEGFHVIYYTGTSAQAWEVLAREKLQEAFWRDWFDALMDKTEIIRHEDVLAHAGGY